MKRSHRPHTRGSAGSRERPRAGVRLPGSESGTRTDRGSVDKKRSCAAAVSLLLGRVGRWSGREIGASQAERLGRSRLSIARSALSLARSARMERDNESCFFVTAVGVHRFIRRYHVKNTSTRGLMVDLEGGHSISSITRHNPVVFDLVGFVMTRAVYLFSLQGLTMKLIRDHGNTSTKRYRRTRTSRV